MYRLVSGIDQAVANWVANQLEMQPFTYNYTAAGVMKGEYLVAGVVAENFKRYEFGNVMEAHIASIEPGWVSRGILRELFSYPFLDMSVMRLEVRCKKSNKRGRHFVKRLGFTEEGVLKRAWDGWHDAVVYRMFPEDCIWIGEVDGRGQKSIAA